MEESRFVPRVALSLLVITGPLPSDPRCARPKDKLRSETR